MKFCGNGTLIPKAHEEIAKILRNEPHTLLVKALKGVAQWLKIY
jgi:hypothetical protein